MMIVKDDIYSQDDAQIVKIRQLDIDIGVYN
jgi:hypothetical protein